MEFYNKRGTAELYIKEGKHTFNWTRLSCKRFRDNQARLQLHALAYNLTAILRNIELPEEMKKWSLSTIQLKLKCQSAFNGDPLSSSNGDPLPRGGTGGEAPPPGQPAGTIHPNPFYADHPWLPFLRCPMRRSCYSQRAGSN